MSAWGSSRRYAGLRLLTGERGLSLVELLVGMIILLITLSLGYSFYFFGARTYSEGEAQSDVQQNVRLLADTISRELRFAETAEIFGSGYAISEDYNYLYLDGTEVKLRRTGETSATTLLTSISGNVDFSLNFKRSPAADNILSFEVSGTDGSKNHSLTSELLLANMGYITVSTASGATVAGGGSGVCFLSPKPPDGVIKQVEVSPSQLLDGEEGTLFVTVTTDYVNNGALAWCKMYDVVIVGEDQPAEEVLIAESGTSAIYGNTVDLSLNIVPGLSADEYKIEVKVDEVRVNDEEFPFIMTYVVAEPPPE